MSMMSDLGFDGENKPIIHERNPIKDYVDAKYRKYVMEANCDDPCPGCGAEWKREPLGTGKTQIHAPHCDMQRWINEQDKINDA